MQRQLRSLLIGLLACLIVMPANVGASSLMAQQCELVELRPGYPGYRGFITGVDGIGDHACLEELEDEDAFFSKDDEDDENRRAARRLGLRGGPDVWTWENWLMIEAERGLIPTCYYCAFMESPERPEPRGTNIERDDPRLLLGEIGGTAIFDDWWDRNGQPNLWGLRPTDYELRAIAMAFYGDLNAEEALEVIEDVLDMYIGESAQGIDPRSMWDHIIQQGGYFNVPDSAAIEDQFFAIYIGLEALRPHIGDDNMTRLGNLLEVSWDDWQLVLTNDEFNGSFGAYLRAIDAEEWL